eukprot:11194151-Lingulodinium_polyedra.AAC.1
MSINVLYRILPRALYAAGLLADKVEDACKTKVFNLANFEKHVLPDASREREPSLARRGLPGEGTTMD